MNMEPMLEQALHRTAGLLEDLLELARHAEMSSKHYRALGVILERAGGHIELSQEDLDKMVGGIQITVDNEKGLVSMTLLSPDEILKMQGGFNGS